jgi:hypothetical protein
MLWGAVEENERVIEEGLAKVGRVLGASVRRARAWRVCRAEMEGTGGIVIKGYGTR